MAGEKRIERLQKQILRILSKKVLYEMNDPRLSAMLTLTKVKLNRDLSLAKVFFSTLGDEKEKIKAGHVLNHASAHLRRELGHELQIRVLPNLEFTYDASIDHAIRISATLDRLKKEFMPDETDLSVTPNAELTDSADSEQSVTDNNPADANLKDADVQDENAKYVEKTEKAEETDDANADEANPDAPK